MSDAPRPIFPKVNVHQLHGIEIDPYSCHLARVVVLIAYLHWVGDTVFGLRPLPRPAGSENTITIADLVHSAVLLGYTQWVCGEIYERTPETGLDAKENNNAAVAVGV